MAVSIGLVIGIIFIWFLLVAMVVTFIIIFNRVARGDVPPNSPIIWSLYPKQTGGYSTLVYKKHTSPESGNNKIVTAKPLSVPYNHKGKPIKVSDVDFPIDEEHQFNLPNGMFDFYRNIKIILPDKATKLPRELRNHPFGQILSMHIEKIDLTDKAVKLIEQNNIDSKEALSMLKKEENQIWELWKESTLQLIEEKIKEKGKD